MSISDAVWAGNWLIERRRTDEAEDRADKATRAMDRLADALGAANDRLVVTKAERDSFKGLAGEMVDELKGRKTRRLSLPEADGERKAYLHRTYGRALEEHHRELEASYAQKRPEDAEQLRNNSVRRKNGGFLK